MPHEISPSELVKQDSLYADAILIDVRDPDEHAKQHISGSINIPLSDLADALPEYSIKSIIVFVCQTGQRSRQACSFTNSLGYTRAYNLQGGISEWLKLPGPY